MRREELATTYALLRRLFRDFGRAHLVSYLVAFFFMGLVAACTSLSAWVMRDVINQIFVNQNRAALFFIPLAIVVIFMVKGIATYCQETMLGSIGNSLIAQAQKRMFDRLLEVDVSFFQRYPSSDLITRMTRNAEAVRDMLNTAALSMGRDLLTVAGLITVMVMQDPLMTVIALAGAPLATLGVRSLMRRVREAAASELHSSASIVASIRETSQGIRLIKAFQLEQVLRGRTFEAIEAVERLVNRMIKVQARISPMIETLGGVTIALVVLYAGWRNLSYGDTPGQFFAFITALLLAADPSRRLSRVPLQLAGAGIGVRMMYEIIDTPPIERDEPGTAELQVGNGEIRFERISFAYDPSVPVLAELSLAAPAGKTTALVGSSGAGKSTIFNLMQRFWIPNSGHILIDGQSIVTVSVRSLRANIAYVSQDAFLFEGTIRDNIQAGSQNATDNMMVAAAEAAQIDEFVRTLPQSYDTPVGELGSRLSGGQRQRISIARAILKDAPIILLDEPTSALDSETEESIQRALKKLTRGKTTLVIAHRLSTILHSDLIHVVDKGQVVESGTHANLLERAGVYARLHRLQFGDVANAQHAGESKTDTEFAG